MRVFDVLFACHSDRWHKVSSQICDWSSGCCAAWVKRVCCTSNCPMCTLS